MAALWQIIKGKETPSVSYLMVPRRLINLLEQDIGLMANWIKRAGYGTNLKELKILTDELDIKMTSLSNWLIEKAFKRINSKQVHKSNLRKRFEPAPS